MRHNIDRYADLNSDEFGGWMIGFGILAFLSVFGFLMGVLPPAIPWLAYASLAGMLPAATHGALAATHINRNLGSTHADLMQTYHKLPKSLRSDMHLTRDEVLTLSHDECYALRTKMDEALRHFNRDHNGPVGRVNSILDSHIDTYKELENMS